MKWLYKLEYKYKKYALSNIMLYIVIGNLMVYLAMMVAPGANLYSLLIFHWPSILEGQIWRLFTFVFVATPQSPMFMAIALFFDYYIGSVLERSMGAFRFNVYILSGVLLTSLFGITAHYIMLLLPGGAYLAFANFITAEQFFYSLFLVFAMMYPETPLRFMFILPLKAKHLGIFYAALALLNLITGHWGTRIAIIAALVNFLIFFGNRFIKDITKDLKYQKARRQWRQNNNYRN